MNAFPALEGEFSPSGDAWGFGGANFSDCLLFSLVLLLGRDP